MIWMLAAFFFVAQVGVAYRWQSVGDSSRGIEPFRPYSFFANTISDLGETAKFTYGHPRMWSPDHLWMNLAFGLLGLCMIVGSPLIYQEFTEDTRAKVHIALFAFTAQGLAGLGVLMVAFFPENEHPLPHELGAALGIAVGTLSVFLLGLSLPLPGRIRRFMLWTGPVSLTAILLYALHAYLGFGPGGMERVAAYPEVIWLITFGFYISRSHLQGSAHRSPSRPSGIWAGRGFEVDVAPVTTRLRLPAASLLPAAKQGEPYSVRLRPFGGTGRPLQFSERTYEQVGLSLATDGVLSGAPTKRGLTRIPVQVSDEADNVSKTYTLMVGGARRKTR